MMDEPLAETFRDEVRRRYPNLLAKAGRSRVAGIRLFCIECMGGARGEAIRCQLASCFLWPHRGPSWSVKT